MVGAWLWAYTSETTRMEPKEKRLIKLLLDQVIANAKTAKAGTEPDNDSLLALHRTTGRIMAIAGLLELASASVGGSDYIAPSAEAGQSADGGGTGAGRKVRSEGP